MFPMRHARSLLRGEDAAYHAMSRTVAGEFLFTQREREVFRNLLYRQARFSQVLVHTYTCLSNHFHIVLRVPGKVHLTDQQLLRRLRRYYGREHLNTLRFERAQAEGDEEQLQALRQRYLARMGDLSIFMKELKETFSRWFNFTHDRFGTLWAERFGSVLLPVDNRRVLGFCAYVDLNPLRAGLVRHPKDWAHGGYAEAVARNGPARYGLARVLEGRTWQEKSSGYELHLLLTALRGRANQATLTPEEVYQLYQEGAHLSFAQALLTKVVYFSMGGAVGDKEFVEKVFNTCHSHEYKARTQGAYPMEGADWDNWFCLKKFKQPIQKPKKHAE